MQRMIENKRCYNSITLSFNYVLSYSEQWTDIYVRVRLTSPRRQKHSVLLRLEEARLAYMCLFLLAAPQQSVCILICSTPVSGLHVHQEGLRECCFAHCSCAMPFHSHLPCCLPHVLAAVTWFWCVVAVLASAVLFTAIQLAEPLGIKVARIHNVWGSEWMRWSTRIASKSQLTILKFDCIWQFGMVADALVYGGAVACAHWALK